MCGRNFSKWNYKLLQTHTFGHNRTSAKNGLILLDRSWHIPVVCVRSCVCVCVRACVRARARACARTGFMWSRFMNNNMVVVVWLIRGSRVAMVHVLSFVASSQGPWPCLDRQGLVQEIWRKEPRQSANTKEPVAWRRLYISDKPQRQWVHHTPFGYFLNPHLPYPVYTPVLHRGRSTETKMELWF